MKKNTLLHRTILRDPKDSLSMASECTFYLSRVYPRRFNILSSIGRRETERKSHRRGKKRMKRRWYSTIITGIRCSDNTTHASLPSFSISAFARHSSRVRDLIQFCLFLRAIHFVFFISSRLPREYK